MSKRGRKTKGQSGKSVKKTKTVVPETHLLFPVPKDIVEKLIGLYSSTPAANCGSCEDHYLTEMADCVGCGRGNYICRNCSGYKKEEHVCACCKGYLCRVCREDKTRCDVYTVEGESRKKCHNDVMYCRGCKEKLRKCIHCDTHLQLCHSRWSFRESHFLSTTEYNSWMDSHENACVEDNVYHPTVEKIVTIKKI